ncbi:hypothetical protein EJB05_21442, partial [Eragrostis curvula]
MNSPWCQRAREERERGYQGACWSGRQDSDGEMSRGRSGGRGRDLKLNLNLSPPPPPRERTAASSDEESSPSSCLSSEGEGLGHGLQWSDSPEATSMVLAACPRCLMYVMLSETDPRCPRCLNPVLLDFLQNGAGGENLGRNSTRGGRRNRRA